MRATRRLAVVLRFGKLGTLVGGCDQRRLLFTCPDSSFQLCWKGRKSTHSNNSNSYHMFITLSGRNGRSDTQKAFYGIARFAPIRMMIWDTYFLGGLLGRLQ